MLETITSLGQWGMAGIIFAGFLMVLKWVFEVNNKILNDMAEERKLTQQIHNGFIQKIQEMSAVNKEFQKTVDEAHRFQRDEHKEMIEVLGRINGYKH